MNIGQSSPQLSEVGKHFIVGLQKSASLTAHDEQLLSILQPAGIILFRENFMHGAPYEEWISSLHKLIEQVRACIDRKSLLISIDHEGSKVFRTPPPITNFGPAARWGEKCAEIGAAMGIELRSLGINLNYAPVVDIHTNRDNPVIGTRAFGTTAEVVTERACSFLLAMEREGVLGCPKHFPGHGDTSVDSHYDLPVVRWNLDELSLRELLPFAAMVKVGAKIVMSSHILYPNIDPEHPATMSPLFLRGILRDELGFKGVITTDDIGMGAVSARFGEHGAATRTLNAGCDILMMSAHWADTNRILGLAQDLLDGLGSGELSLEIFEAAQKRVDALLLEAPAYSPQELPPEVFEAHSAIASAQT